MERFPLAYPLPGAVFAVVLAGCSTGAPTPVATGNAVALDRGHSRTSARVKSSRLLYVADSNGHTVNIYLNKGFVPVGEFVGFTQPTSFCTDAAQNIYVTDIGGSTITEYAHGGAVPIRILNDHQGAPIACAVDLKTGDLAVSNNSGPSSSAGNVIIFKGAKGSPTLFTAPTFSSYYFVGYDNHDNLYVDGYAGVTFQLAELPKGQTAFGLVSLNQAIKAPAAVAWDGEFLAVGDQTTSIIYRFAVSHFTGTVTGSTTLNGEVAVFQFSFQGGSPKHPQATTVVGAAAGSNAVGVWQYPAGGTPVKTVTGLHDPLGAIISP
jgi:hypothetical protein